MLLVLGAMTLFSTLILSVNRGILENSEMVAQGAYRLTATALGQSVIEEAVSKKYDEAVVGTPPVNLPSGFTAPGALGADAGESDPGFDDVDDFNGLVREITTADSVRYHLAVQVGYVDTTDFDVVVSYRTFFKKMRVAVSSAFFSSPSDSTVLKTIFSYWGS